MLILIPVLIAASDLLLILINYLGKLQLPISVARSACSRKIRNFGGCVQGKKYARAAVKPEVSVSRVSFLRK
jgi:hypothetical protein